MSCQPRSAAYAAIRACQSSKETVRSVASFERRE